VFLGETGGKKSRVKGSLASQRGKQGWLRAADEKGESELHWWVQCVLGGGAVGEKSGGGNCVSGTKG